MFPSYHTVSGSARRVDHMNFLDKTDQSKTPGSAPAGKRLEGVVSGWEKDRGFGWVKSGEGSFFVHIREFESGFVPREGDMVTFALGLDPKGRPCAKDAFCPRKNRLPSLSSSLRLAVLLVLPAIANFRLPVAPWMLPLAMLPLSVAAWLLCRHDKERASAGRWRVSETELHGLELFGGWPGSFLAQRKFRHKTRKVSYQAIFWSIVFLYQILSLDVMLDHWIWGEALAFWEEWFIPRTRLSHACGRRNAAPPPDLFSAEGTARRSRRKNPGSRTKKAVPETGTAWVEIGLIARISPF